jgi:hypothetical protein
MIHHYHHNQLHGFGPLARSDPISNNNLVLLSILFLVDQNFLFLVADAVYLVFLCYYPVINLTLFYLFLNSIILSFRLNIDYLVYF